MSVPRVLVLFCLLGVTPALAQTGLEPSGKSPRPPPRRVVLPVAVSVFLRDWSTNSLLASEQPVANVLALGMANGGTTLHGLGLGLAGNWYEEETWGVLVAGFSNNVSGETGGLQVAGFANLVEGWFAGLQVTPGTNVAQAGMRGLQVSGVGNGAGHLHGAQVTAAAMNFAGGDVRGAQLVALGANDAKDLIGVQLAGLGNASRSLSGVQVALFGNSVSREMRGLQLALVNVGGDVSGAQVGLINIADTVRGTQLGLLNVSKAMKGLPLGLLSFEEGGPFHLETWASDIQLLNVGVKFGGRHTYTTLFAGLGPDDRLQRYSLGIGLGGRILLGTRFWVELDMAGSVVRRVGQPLLGGANVLAQGRLMLGFSVFKRLAVFAGPTYNAYFAWSDEDRLTLTTLPVREHQLDAELTLQRWPGMQFGLRL